MRRFAVLYPKEVLEEMYLTMDQAEIAKKTGYSTRHIYRHIKKWNIQKRVSGRSCPWTQLEDDNELINYFGGFCYADGSLVKTSITGYMLNLSISKKDEYIIKEFHEKIVGSKYHTYTDAANRPMVSLHLHGTDLPEKLLRFGVTNGKRYNWTRPVISDNMISHFLRGWFDGDGYIGKNKYTLVLTNINRKAIEYYDEKLRFIGYVPKIRNGSIDNPVKEYFDKNRKPVYRHIITGKENCEQVYDLLECNSKLKLNRKWSLIRDKFNSN